MFKFLTSLLIIISISVTVFAKDDTYVFEAKGAFAKELKALIDKYSKEGKIEAKVYKKSPRDKSIIGSILGGGDGYTKSGKELYMKNCASCHGEKGEKFAGAGSRPLINMSEEDIVTALENYKRDEHFGGPMKMLMYDIAVPLRGVEIEEIAAYIKGKSSPSQSVESDEEESEEETSSYLK